MTTFTDLLSAFASDKRFICHLQPWDTGANATVDLYYSTHGFTSAPGDTPANQHYESRLASGYTFTRSLFSSGKLSGRTILGAGKIRLINQDGGLDGLSAYAWGGRRMRVWLGGPDEDFALSDYGLVVDATAQGISFQNDAVEIELRDLSYIFDREIQPTTFAGSGGVEGGADVSGKRKPQPWGVVREIRPIYIGLIGGLHSFSLGDGEIVGVLGMRDAGYLYDYTSGTPSGAQYSVDLANATISLGTTYVGPVTVSVIGKAYLNVTSASSVTIGTGTKSFTITAGLALASGMKVRARRTSAKSSTWMDGTISSYSGTTLQISVSSGNTLGSGTFTDWTISPWGTAAGIMKAIGTALGATSFDTASFTALDAAQPAAVGYWIPEGGNGLQHLDAIANGIAGYYGFNRAGQFNVGRLSAPAGSVANYGSLAVYPASEAPPIEDTLQRIPSSEPNYRVVVQGNRAWGFLASNEIVAAVSDADRAFLSNEWRQSIATDSAVLTDYPLSEVLTVDSILDDTADMASEVTRLAGMFGVPRDFLEATFKLQPLARDLPQTITLYDARYDLDAGKALRIVDMDEDTTPETCQVKLQVWG
jgi:hypothetical protein